MGYIFPEKPSALNFPMFRLLSTEMTEWEFAQGFLILLLKHIMKKYQVGQKREIKMKKILSCH